MKLNPPAIIRQTLYLISVFVNTSVGVLIANDVEVSVVALAIIAGYNAVVAILAGANVTSSKV